MIKKEKKSINPIDVFDINTKSKLNTTIESDLFIQFGFKPSKYLVHNIYAINKKIEDAKQDFNHHDKISDKIWNSIIKNSKTSDTVTLINVANTHKDLSNAAVSKIKRLHLDKDEAIKQGLDNNKYL